MRLRFKLDGGALKRRERLFGKAQTYIDSECIRLMTPSESRTSITRESLGIR